MGLGDILGSISPAYGAITGQGLGGVARNLNPIYFLLHNFGGGDGGQPQKAPVAGQMPVNTGANLTPPASLPGIASAASSAPGMASGGSGPLAMIGNALKSTAQPDQGIVAPPQLPMQNNGLGAILAQILGSM